MPFAWDGTREVNKETELDKKGKRVLGVAAVNAGEREVGGSRSTASVRTELPKSFCSPGQWAGHTHATHLFVHAITFQGQWLFWIDQIEQNKGEKKW